MARPTRRDRRHRVGPIVALVAVAAVAGATLAACSADGEPGPMVDRIDDAITAVETFYGAPQDYLEISATESLVSLIVSTDGGAAAEQAFWSPDDGLVEPVPVASVDRPTFLGGDVDLRPDGVLDQLRAELPESQILDFAITGAGEGAVVYDARVRSEQGGVLLVLLDGDGRILGAQGE